MNTQDSSASDPRTARAVLGRVRTFITRHGLLSPGEPVLAAVSGGGDSMALLGVLLDLGYRVTAAHLDHGTRVGQSAEDAAFVAEMCERLGVPLVLERTSVDSERRRGESFETAARRIRYAFLERIAGERGLGVATGHQAEDQAETVVMRLRRGAGLRGLGGMAPARPLGRSRLIRPLLTCRREELRAYLRARGIPWREDATNTDPESALRNRVRLELQELVEMSAGYEPDPVATLCAAAERARREWRETLAALTDARAALGVPAPERGVRVLRREGLERMDPYLRRVWWMLWMEALGHEPSARRVRALDDWFSRGQAGSCYPLGRAGLVVLGRNEVIVTEAREAEEGEVSGGLELGEAGGEVCLGGWRLRWVVRAVRETERERPREACGPLRQLLDADRLTWPVRARFFRPGDRIRPLGMGGRTRKLQDYFTDRGVPVPERRRVPLVESGGEIVWVAGQGPSETARVTVLTRNVLEIEGVPPARPG